MPLTFAQDSSPEQWELSAPIVGPKKNKYCNITSFDGPIVLQLCPKTDR